MDNTPGQPLALPEVTPETLDKLEAAASAVLNITTPALRGARWRAGWEECAGVPCVEVAQGWHSVVLLADKDMRQEVGQHLAAADPLQVLALVAELRRLNVTLVAEREERQRLGNEVLMLRESLASIPGNFVALEDWAEVCEPFLALAAERLSGQSYEPIPREACARLLAAFGRSMGGTSSRMPANSQGWADALAGVKWDFSKRGGVMWTPPAPSGTPRNPKGEAGGTQPRATPGTPDTSLEEAQRHASALRHALLASGRFPLESAVLAEHLAQVDVYLQHEVMLAEPEHVRREEVAAVGTPEHTLWLVRHNLAAITQREAMTVRALDEAGVPPLVDRAPGIRSAFPDDRVRWLAAHRVAPVHGDAPSAVAGLLAHAVEVCAVLRQVGTGDGGAEEDVAAAVESVRRASAKLAPPSAFTSQSGAGTPSTSAPPEAFTRSAALEPDMPGLPEDGEGE